MVFEASISEVPFQLPFVKFCLALYSLSEIPIQQPFRAILVHLEDLLDWLDSSSLLLEGTILLGCSLLRPLHGFLKRLQLLQLPWQFARDRGHYSVSEPAKALYRGLKDQSCRTGPPLHFKQLERLV